MRRRFTIIVLLLSILLTACNLPTTAVTKEAQPDVSIQTMAAQTVEAMSTLFAATALPTATANPEEEKTATQPPVATNTMMPTSILPTASKTPRPVPCDRASFVSDVTIDDDTLMAAGTTFTKTWRLKNNGTCTWDTNYRLIFTSGDAMGAPSSGAALPAVVAPGGTVDISATLTAPSSNRSYQADFMLQNSSGTRFGIGENADKSFYVKIMVGSTATSSVFAVTSVSINSNPSTYNGACDSGVKITFTGKITVNRSGTVKYHFYRSDGASGEVKTIDFSEAGTQTVTDSWTLSTDLTGWEKIYIDSPNHQSLGEANFTLTCS
jgi:hypothetical protein